MKRLEETFEDNLSFINKYEEIINSHLVDFITKNSWEKCLPLNLRTDLDKLENLSFSELLVNSPMLKEIIEEINSQNLRNNSETLELRDLSKFLSEDNFRWEEKNFYEELQNDFMKDKKRYEISVLSSVIGQLAADNETLVIDAGGGRGYLATHLSEEYNIPVLSIDSNPSRNKSAVDRQLLMERRKHRSFSLAQYTINFIDNSTNYVELVKEHFPNWSGGRYVLTGLHTCGSLAHAVIKAFTSSEALKILCVVSCCYHLADQFLTTDFILPKNARMLAQQSVERISAKNGEHSPSLFYRALLQVLLRTLERSAYSLIRYQQMRQKTLRYTAHIPKI